MPTFVDLSLPPRRVVPHLSIEGTAVAGPFAANLLSFTFQDYMTAKADSLDLRIEDTSGRWLESWAPDEGQRIEASLDLQAEGRGISTLDCGAFEVDSIGAEGPPSTVTIQGTSTSVTATLRRTERSQAWENVKLSTIHRQIAERHGLRQITAGGNDPTYDRVSQQRSSDLAFLVRLATEAGLYVRVTRGGLWMGDRQSLVEEAETVVLTRAEITRYRFESRGYVRYRACEVSYHRPQTRTTVRATATAPRRRRPAGSPPLPRRPRTPRPSTVGTVTQQLDGATIGEVLRITRRADTLQEAQRMAVAYLAEANRASVRAEVTLPGRPDLTSGVLLDLQGFGQFSGARLVEVAEHSYSRGSGYVTRLGLLNSESAGESDV